MEEANLFTLRITPKDISANPLCIPDYLFALMEELKHSGGAKGPFWNTDLPWIYCWESTDKYLEPIPPHLHFVFWGYSTKESLRKKIKRECIRLKAPILGSKYYCLQEKIEIKDLQLIYRYMMKSGPFTHDHLGDIPGFLVNDQSIIAKDSRKQNSIYHKLQREKLLHKASTYDRMTKHMTDKYALVDSVTPDTPNGRFNLCKRNLTVAISKWYLNNTNHLCWTSISSTVNHFMVINKMKSLEDWVDNNLT